MDNNYPPYVFLDGKGNLQGILIDQWQLWEQKTGIRADVSGMDWGEAMSRMGAGEFDVIDTIFFNEQRAQIYDFSKPYVKIDVSIFFHKSISGISGADSLRGFAVAVKSGDNAIDHLKEKGVGLFQEYPSYEAIVRAAKEQKVMVTVIDNPPALYFLYKMGILDQFRYSVPLYTGEFHRAVRKGDTAILKLVEEGFSQISESERQAINRKWFGTEARVFYPYLRHIAIGLGGLIAIALFLLAWNRTLRKKVYERTLRLEEEVALNVRKTEALQVSEEKYRELVENANSIILRMDATGTITFFNEYASRFLGFSLDEIIGRNVVGTIVPPIDSAGKDLAQMILNISIHPEQYRNNENENMCKDGTRVWVAWTNKPILDDQGRCVEILCIGNDITEHKQTVEALLESEEKFRVLAESTPNAIMIYQNNKRVYANPAAERITGYSLQELATMDFWTFVHPDYRNLIQKRGQKRQTGEPTVGRYEFKIVTKDGTEKWVDLSGASMMLGGSPAGIISVMDITDRKQAEEALRKSEDKYRTLIETTDTGFVIIDKNGLVIDANPEYVRLTGHKDLSEIVGRSVIEWTADAEKEKNAAAIKAVIEKGYVRNLEIDYMDSKGNITPIEINATSIEIEGQIQTITICRDITDRKRAEEERQKLHERLQHAHKMESIGTLAGGIAHDFNNLLMGIQGCASLMMLDLDPSHPHYERLKQIEEQVNSGASLTGQLLGFARGGRYEVKPTDMNDLIKRTSSMFGRTKKEIVIHRKYVKDPLSVEVDRGQMEQVFMNLYVNAWQAMPAGGEIYLETENVLLDDKQAFSYAVKPGRYIKISMTDTGTGMDEKTKERIFDPFYTTKELGRGTGLGLAVVYGIIKNHNGHIVVISEPGKGTTFALYFPTSEKEIAKEKPAGHKIMRGTETILLVDDEPHVLAVSKKMLESLGYTAYGVKDGKEAIALYREKKDEIDLVVLDMIMPELSGSETFDLIRELKPSAKIILSSGYSLNDEAQRIMDKGCHGFIQKPFDVAGISRKVREVLDQ